MNINYHAPFSINDYLKGLISEKVERMEHNGKPLMKVDVYFALKDGPESVKDKELELKVHIPGHVVFAKSYAESFEKAIPDVADKVRRQLEKYKGKLEPKGKGKIY